MGRVRTRADLDRAVERIRAGFSGEIGFVARNIATGEAVEINPDAVFPTASAVKLAVLVEVFRRAAGDGLDLDQRLPLRPEDVVGGSGILKELTPGLAPTVRDLATLMVVLSDNTATNLLIDLVGGVAAVNRTSRGLGLPTLVLHNRIDFGRIGGEVRRFAESSPRDLARLVELVAAGTVVDAASSAAMLAILGRQLYLDQVPRYLNVNPYAADLRIEPPIWVGCKTGFFPGTRVDTGLIRLPDNVAIAYCAMTVDGRDHSFAPENEGAVTNGLLGRLVVEYWWPGGAMPDGAGLPSPYVDAVLG